MRFQTILTALFTAGLCACPGRAQSPDRGALSAIEESALFPRFESEYVFPQLHKWYSSRHLLETYWQPWYQTATGYARQPYSRYVDRLLEGDEFYDALGSPVGRGWLVYSWTQQQPQAGGSEIFKLPPRNVRNTSEALAFGTNQGFSAYDRFFDSLVIASDQRGRSAYRLMVGDQIYTRFTPLTFYKPRYNGLRFDIAGERYSGTMLLSRPSDPNGPSLSQIGGAVSKNGTNATHLWGGHADFVLGDQARAGLTYVNAHNIHTELELNNGNPLNGTLTVQQNQPLRKLWVRLRDDSPADQSGGAVLLAHDIVLVDTSGRELRGSEIGFLPEIEGGISRGGALVADGSEHILLTYDLESLDHEGVRSADLRGVHVELNLADDYRIEASSNLQTDGLGRVANPIFLTEHRSPGNVQDRSNTGAVKVDYGLPVASEILGFDWDIPNWRSLSLQGEVAINRRLRRYPNPVLKRHHQTARMAAAMYAQLAYRRYPWQLFVEGFSMEDDYSTSYWLTDPGGMLYYHSPVPQLYEFVDDDDDLDAVPEWQRPYQLSSNEIALPGYDENGDFLEDHNQNANLIPDYEEPFLRFRSDRPEFLFGLDMNHNGTIDRFENDELPDYPYKRDHRGFNAYLKAHAGPDAEWTVGRQNMRLISGDGRTRSWYILGTWTRLLPAGRLRLFAHGALVRDDIPDDLVQWFQPIDARGRMLAVPDDLPARNTWKNLLYADLDHRLGPGIRLQHRFKWERMQQRDSDESLRVREGRRTSGFAGLIDRMQWSIPIGLGTLEPRFKSELRHQRPFSTRRSTSTTLEEIAILLWSQPLLAEKIGVNYFPRYGRQRFKTTLQLGFETSRFWLIEGRREEISEDFWRWTLIAQLVNRVAYEGYQLVTRTGLRLSAWHFEHRRGQRTNMLFMTINAGLR
jgi:hypothetical protein